MKPPSPERLADWNRELAGTDADGILAWAAATFPARVALASSFGLEDQALIHLIASQQRDIAVFTLDTGRLFPETYELIAATRERYRIAIKIFVPDAITVEALVAEHGIACYRQSVALRKACCNARKVMPLQRALAPLDAWICGLRRGQGPTRSEVEPVIWDEANQRVKISPLAQWDEVRLREFLANNQVPVNPLHERGFPSIGCACCTRAITPGEDPRAGRWWWEEPEHKECGLHRTR